MSGPEEMIADALREIAARAGAPRPMADAAWRAGRRRRLAALTASALAGAAAIVAAVLLSLAAADGPAHGQPPSRPASQQELAPISLRSPIQFRQVAAISNASCPAGSRGLPGSTAPGCVFLRVECDAGPGYLTIVECRPRWRKDLGPQWTRFPIARDPR